MSAGKRLPKETRAFLLVLAVSAACSLRPCRDNLSATAYSPTHEQRAEAFWRDCGDTTMIVAHVSILSKDEKLSGPGNVFRSEMPRHAYANRDLGMPGVGVRWVGKDTVIIHYDPRSRVLSADSSFGDLTIRYVADST